MTRDETLAVMSILKAAYPQYYRGMKAKDANEAVDLWHTMLADQPAELVAAAVKSFIATDAKGFPPTIGQLNHEMAALVSPKTMTAMEAWALVKQAVANSEYDAEREFRRLPLDVRRMVGHPTMLREWRMLDKRELNTVVASNFMRSWREWYEIRRREQVIPSEVKSVGAQIAAHAAQAALPEAEKKTGRYDYAAIRKRDREYLKRLANEEVQR